MSVSSTIRLTASGAAALLATALGWPSQANVVVSSYTDSTHFSFQRVGIPDIDQERTGLPNVGKCYCVPTSTMNLFMYAANHGFPSIEPGPGTWTGYDHYADIGAWLDDLGAMMSICPGGDNPQCDVSACDPEGDCDFKCGGGGQPALDGLLEWLGDEADFFTVTVNSASGEWAPRLHHLAQIAVSPGAPLMRVSYGRYEQVGQSPDGYPIRKRSGGHAVSFAGCVANGAQRFLYSRDPAQDEDPVDVFGQSPFATKEYTVQTATYQLTSQEGPGVTTFEVERQMDVLDWPSSDGKARLIDGVVTIRPKYGYSFTETSILNVPMAPGGFAVELPPPGGVPVPGGVINDLAIDADGLGLVLLVAPGAPAAPRVQYFNPILGTTALIAIVAQAQGLVSGRQHDLYVHSNPSGGIGLVQRFRPAGGNEGGDYVADATTLTLPYALHAAVYVDHTDTLRLVAAAARKLVDAPRNLGSEVDPVLAYDIPTALPLATDADAAHEPGTGRTWVCSGASDCLYGLSLSSSFQVQWETICLPAIVDPTGLSFDDAGRLHVRCAAGVIVLKRNPSGAWLRDSAAEAAFAGLTLGPDLLIARSRTNFNPAIHDTPEWEQIDPADLLDIGRTLPDCPGDLDGNGAVDVQDLVDLILSWGPCAGCAADLDGDDAVGVTDLVALILAWGPC
jgi:hypothetical protein